MESALDIRMLPWNALSFEEIFDSLNSWQP